MMSIFFYDRKSLFNRYFGQKNKDKIKELNKTYFMDNNREKYEIFDKKQYQKIIFTLYIANLQLLMKYKTWYTHHYFSDFVVLKKIFCYNDRPDSFNI